MGLPDEKFDTEEVTPAEEMEDDEPSSPVPRTSPGSRPRSEESDRFDRRSREDQKAFRALIQCQEKHMKKILRELDHGAKESCWAWYIFPTEKAGMCDFDGTRITKDNAVDLCNNESTAMDWQKCLEKICDLLEARDKRPPDSHVLPRIDHGRVHWFIKFWAKYEKTPEWLLKVCERLEQFNFPPS
ncbi:Carboxylic ester hydrolase [Durusdinium trenchii]|uniref:Carboxylic ester hydrolase n=1 Tax=Durusdinium trenchii TaxID=1381693 RepID=A0ABP0NSA5_9DINO